MELPSTTELYEIEETLLQHNLSGGGGGKGGSGKKVRSPNSATSKQARRETRNNAQSGRLQEATEQVMKVMRNFPNCNEEEKPRMLEKYRNWINWCLLKQGEPLSENDCDITFVRASKGAGGQNVNKVNSCAQITHLITNISVQNEETRDQPRNKAKALSILKDKLVKHLDDWKVVLTGARSGVKAEELSMEKLLGAFEASK